MKTLTIKQPWASLIIKGIKDVENQSWEIPMELPTTIHIHAGTKPDPDAVEYLRNGSSEDCKQAQQALKDHVLPSYVPMFVKTAHRLYR